MLIVRAVDLHDLVVAASGGFLAIAAAARLGIAGHGDAVQLTAAVMRPHLQAGGGQEVEENEAI